MARKDKLPLGVRRLPNGRLEAVAYPAPKYKQKSKTFPATDVDAAGAWAKQNTQLPAGVRLMPSLNFQARYRGLDSKTHYKTMDTPMKASAWLENELALLALGPEVWAPPATREAQKRTGALTVGEWMDQFHEGLEADGIRATSMQRYRRTTRTRITEVAKTIKNSAKLTPIEKERMLHAAQAADRLRNLPVTRLARADVYGWWYSIVDTYPDAPTANYQAYLRLRAAMSEAVRREIIDINVVDIPAATKRPKPDQTKKYLPSLAEVAAIIKATPKNYQLAVALCLRAGLRRGEALGVDIDDLDKRTVDGQVIYYVRVRRQVHRLEPEGEAVFMRLGELKTEASYRTIPLPTDINPIIETHLDKHVRPARKVLTQWGVQEARLLTTTNRGTMVSPNSLADQLKKWVKAAGANPLIHLHSGRYLVNTISAEAGATPKEIGEYLGEVDLTTIVEVYQQVRAGRLEVLAAGLNAVRKAA